MKLEVREARKQDLPELKRMIDEFLALDYYSMEELESCIRGESNLFYVVTDGDRQDGAIVSFYYAFLAPLDEALRALHVPGRPAVLREYAEETRVGVYKTASTLREYRGCGICSSFVRDLEPVMRERGARMILATAWRTPDGKVAMKQIFHDTGFQAAEIIRRPWESMDLYCTGCGRRHCICDAVFYVKNLEDKEAENGE